MLAENLTENERYVILGFCIMGAVLNFLVLCLVLINACRHLMLRKMTKRIIIFFYLFALLNVGANGALLTMTILKPELAISDLDLSTTEEIPIPVIVQAATNLGLFLINGLSMYVFTITFQMVKDELDHS